MCERGASLGRKTSAARAKLVTSPPMKRLAAVSLAAVFALGACASTSTTKYSYTPKTQVTVKGGKKKSVQANYQVSPEESLGSGGSEK